MVTAIVARGALRTPLLAIARDADCDKTCKEMRQLLCCKNGQPAEHVSLFKDMMQQSNQLHFIEHRLFDRGLYASSRDEPLLT